MTTITTARPTTRPVAAGLDVRRTRALRRTLRLNALTSVIGGLTAAIGAAGADRLLGTASPGWVRVVGLGLVVFGIDVGAATMLGVRRLASVTPWISAVDLAWVAASVATIVLGWFSTTGALVIGGVAMAVAAFGAGQLLLCLRLAG